MPKCSCGCDNVLMVWNRNADGSVTLALRQNGCTERELELTAKSVADLVESLGGVMPEVVA